MTKLRIGEWCVDPVAGEISRDGETARVEARTMRLLLCLAERAGEVVSMEELLDRVWAGVTVSQDSVYQAVTSLRRLLGDDPKQPAYIATVPRLGYRMVAAVGPWADPQAISGLGAEVIPTASVRKRNGLRWVLGAAACVALGFLALLIHGKAASNSPAIDSGAAAVGAQPGKLAGAVEGGESIAVLPFLDLTEGMKNEEFADGMTEELIDRLSRIPGMRVPGATSSFYFKGKQIPVAEIARALGVAYVLDGSVRKSEGRLRVSARLVRADNGYVVWTDSYDRPFDDALMIQDDIAGEVTKALRRSIEAKPVR